jgi:phosphoglycolate phosphatase
LAVAIATSDDHAPTVATLANLGVLHLVDVLIAADDGVPLKPAPDMVYAACAALAVPPAQVIVVGDALPELEMARAAGAGLAIAVSNGVTPAALLAPLAAIVLPSIAALLEVAPASA